MPNVTTLLVALLMTSAMGCQEAVDHLGVQRAALIEGSPAPEHTSVAAVVSPQHPNYTFCTATVIAPRVLVTAAHCIVNAKANSADVYVVFADVVTKTTARIAVTEMVPHPDFSLKQLTSARDVGLLALADDAPVPVVPFARTVPETGAEATLVGYGFDTVNETGIGTRRQRGVRIGELAADWLALPESGSCDGDSGGPILLGPPGSSEIVAVHSKGDCGGDSTEARLDSVRDTFILPFLQAHASCAADSACATSCDSPDPDCAADAGVTSAGAEKSQSEGGCGVARSAPSPSAALVCGVGIFLATRRRRARSGERRRR